MIVFLTIFPTCGTPKCIVLVNKDPFGGLLLYLGMAKTKRQRVKTLKKKLWTVFSQYIRLRAADHTGWLVTCDGEWKYWKEVHCGHLWHNSERNQQLGGNKLWYYENNFAPQSGDGNTFNKDDSAKKYMMWAIDKYGKKEVNKMYRLKQEYKDWTEEELQKKYEYYKSEVDRMGG